MLLPKFDLYDRAVISDPYPTYAALRDAGPLSRGGPGQWVVPRYADVSRLMTAHRLSGNFSGEYHRLTIGSGPASEFFQRVILNQDPPDHARVRRLMAQALTPSLARDLAPRIAELVDELLAPALDRQRFDAVSDLGYPLPLRVLGELVGIEAGDLAEVGRRAINIAKAFAAVLSPEDRVAAHDSVEWLYDYIAGLLAKRHRARGDDLLSRLLTAEDNGDRLSEPEIIENVIFILFAGFETTMSLIANGCKALLDQPDQLARLQADPTLVPTAVEEFLRVDAPIQVKLRVVLEPIHFGDRVLRPGRVVVLLLGSANHDERQYSHPERIDVGRYPNHHQSFGGGHHRCIGAALARAEAAAVFDRLARRVATLEPAGPAVRQMRPGFRIYDRLPITAVPA
jgi:cytochrome P450